MSEQAPPQDGEQIAARLADGTALLAAVRDQLALIGADLDRRFLAGEDIHTLVTERALRLDVVLDCLWTHYGLAAEPCIALLAVGGYGRGELHPHSDIDLLVLLTDESVRGLHADALEAFITCLWDTRLTIGHSVRTLAECREAAAADITIVTALMEARTLCGDDALRERLAMLTGPGQIWPSADFFRAKWDEQKARHHKFNDTEYNLEPNIKGCPGGLRDVQTVGWVAKRHFHATSTLELVARGFLSEAEYRTLMRGQDFLWRIRYGLHMLAKRAEDRLLFDYQLGLARMFGYADDERGLGVEHFMKDCFRWVLRLGVLNEMLTQLFDEAILRACEPVDPYELNQRFRVCNGCLEVAHDNVFRKSRWALIEMFTLMAQHEFIVGVRATTIRLVNKSGHLIDDELRRDAHANRLFLQLLASPWHVATQLDRMKRYGVLGRFIPEFGGIIGQTQHDLFHVYSVDSHTIRVVRNMRIFLQPQAREEFPIAAHAIKRLPRPELLYLAGLFHDIAKGRGGDHSELGAIDAAAFCNRLELSPRETGLVVWLVRNHLQMSTTAQRKDISDPEVIETFARLVSDQAHLDHLYTLTVADITATNPTLWNSWRASLLHSLYVQTKRALRRGLENPMDRGERIAETRAAALNLLHNRGADSQRVEALWAHMGQDYFLREDAADIAWHTEAILARTDSDTPVVLTKAAGSRFDPVTQIFIYTRDRDHLFAVITATMEQLGLNVHGARLYSSADHHTLDTFFVLEQDGRPVPPGGSRAAQIRRALTDQLTGTEHYLDVVQRHTPRALKYFTVPTETRLTTDPSGSHSILEVMTPDRAGLLARIGRVFFVFGIKVRNARITTLGARVEDVFFITDATHHPIEDPVLASDLQQAIRAALDRNEAAPMPPPARP
ncbi:MAG: [protein-PII] uridylyltransferase [Pseudomonadales bacterium]|nr:[protein-PII] uridylyltransferase [Pseudomonadales bacterium]MCP5319889.1 [protein-PII] uridylyltransferase [Pseudomonadales bacterium]